MKSTLIFLLFLVSCEPKNTTDCHRVIPFINQSDKVLYLVQTNEETNTFDISENPILNANSNKVEPNSTNSDYLSTHSLKACTEEYYQSHSKLRIYIFDSQVLTTNSWADVKANNMYLKRYDLTLQDMKNNNWSVYYP